jgi:uncharacterized membrane protein
MIAELLVLRVVHVLGAIFWLGSGLFTTFFLIPALGKAGPAAAPVMGALQERRLFTWLPIVAVLTLLSGFRLLWIASSGFSAAYVGSAMGQVFLWSGVLATVAFVAGMIIARPAGVKAGQLAASLPSRTEAERLALMPELERLRRRNTVGMLAATVMLVVAAVGMAIARYL